MTRPGLLLSLALSLLLAAPIPLEAASSSLPRATPESQGIASEDLLAFVEAADRQIDTMNSFMLLRHGQVVAEGWWTPYTADTRHVLYSLTKSFTSTAVGFAVAEGKLSIDDPVLKFFPDQAPDSPSENLAAMRVRDLLRMATGHDSEPDFRASSAPWVETFLAHPVAHRPGTHFLYNTPATHMLSEIVQRVTGSTTEDYLGPRLFKPLGIEDPLWLKSPQGTTIGGYGLNVRTEDIARFGQLYLREGLSNGRQLLPREWVQEATAMQVANGSNPDSDWNQGYGYQFWRSRHNSYRGDGAFGQYAIVLPDQDVVLAITSGVADMQAVMDLVFDLLLPAMRAAAVPENPQAHARLTERLSTLRVHTVAGNPSSAAAGEVSGRMFQFDENPLGIENIELKFDKTATELRIRTEEGRHRLPAGTEGWANAESEFAFGLERLPGLPGGPLAVSANGAWQGDDVFTVKICLPETPFYTTVRFRFSGDDVHLEAEPHVVFGPKEIISIVGRKES